MPLNGLHLITPTAVSGSPNPTINANGSVTFSNTYFIYLDGVFSSTYDNYMIVMRYECTASSNGTLYYRLRASGVNNTTTNSYFNQNLGAQGSSITGSSGFTSVGYIGGYGDEYAGMVVNIYGPYLTQPTALRSVVVYDHGGNPNIHDYASTHNQSVAYDGIGIETPTGLAPLSGLISVYGMRK